MQRSETLSNSGRILGRSGAVSNLLFFRRSCAYRNAAVEMMNMMAPSRRSRISGATIRDSHRLLSTLLTIIRSNTSSVSCSSEP